MYLLVENAASTLEGLGTTCNDVSDGGEDKTVLYSKVKDRALKSMALGDDAILERGWERHTFSSGKKKTRPLRLSPGRNIGFCTRKEAFEFEEFCKLYSNNEFKAWPDYKEMKNHLKEPLRVRNPKQYGRWDEYDDISAETGKTDKCNMCFDGRNDNTVAGEPALAKTRDVNSPAFIDSNSAQLSQLDQVEPTDISLAGAAASSEGNKEIARVSATPAKGDCAVACVNITQPGLAIRTSLRLPKTTHSLGKKGEILADADS